MTSPERVLPAVLIGLTAVTGLVDAVSYLALGHVFTANMTGNVVFLGFAVAGAPGLSVMRSGLAVAAFFSNLTPAFAALMSAALLGEPPHGYHLLAFAFIVAGIALSSRRS